MSKLVVTGVVAMVAALGGLVAADAARAGGGCHGAPGGAAPGDAVTIELCAFVPSVLHAAPGQTVTFTNNDDVPHTVTGANWGDTRNLARGDSVSFVFEDEGTYAFSCVLHPGMVGAVVVGDGVSGEQEAVPQATGEGSGGPSWGPATIGALAGMVATGAIGVAFGRRRG